MEAEVILDGIKLMKYVLSVDEVLRTRTNIDWEKDIMNNVENEVKGFYSLPVNPSIILLSKMAKIAFAQYIVQKKDMYGPNYMEWVNSVIYGEDMRINVAGKQLVIMTMNPEQSKSSNFMIVGGLNIVKESKDEKIITQA